MKLDNFKIFINNKINNANYKDIMENIYHLVRYENYTSKDLINEIIEFTSNVFDFEYYNFNLFQNLLDNFKNNNYEQAFNDILYEWKYSFIKITAKWDKNRDHLNRTFYVPSRNNLADLLFAAMTIFRTNIQLFPYIEYEEYIFYLDTFSFIIPSLSETTYPANINSIISLYNTIKDNEFKIHFDTNTVTCNIDGIIYVNAKNYDKNIILKDGNGYGFIEDKMTKINKLLKQYDLDNTKITKELEKFLDTKLDELKENLEGSYTYIYNKYENLSNDDDPNNNLV